MAATTVGVKLDGETRERLKRLGEARQRSTHWLMKEAIARYLEVEERYEREAAEDMARWQRFVETGTAISHEEVKARLASLAEEAAEKASDS
ncbi:MAG: ribbon-helix-helix protein, CopG family [Acidobacteria bacterium]|jgi:predicted transcriptional regulator|nr:ribbon-helix-helix protein, CopG family [Acidobacteriota bacterium]